MLIDRATIRRRLISLPIGKLANFTLGGSNLALSRLVVDILIHDDAPLCQIPYESNET